MKNDFKKCYRNIIILDVVVTVVDIAVFAVMLHSVSAKHIRIATRHFKHTIA